MVKTPKIDAVVCLMNARYELIGLRDHVGSGNFRTKLSLAIGALNHAIEYLMRGEIKQSRGLYTALLQAD